MATETKPVLPVAGYQKLQTTRVSIDECVAKLCDTIGYGPGDVELARFVAGLEARIVELEKCLATLSATR